MAKPSKATSKYWEPFKFVGKSVLDSNKQKCGKVKSIFIDPESLQVSGVLVRKGLGLDYFLPREYFERFSEQALFLNTVPVSPNDKVVDVNGKKLGRVKKIHRNSETNKLESLDVSSFVKGSRNIPISDMVSIGKEITVKAN